MSWMSLKIVKGILILQAEKRFFTIYLWIYHPWCTNCLTSFLGKKCIIWNMIHCFNLTLWYSNFFKQLKVIEVRFGFVYAGVFIVFIWASIRILFLFNTWKVFPVCPLKIILRRYIYINPCCSCRRKCGCDTAITSTFTYTAVEFPNSVAKIFVSLMLISCN